MVIFEIRIYKLQYNCDVLTVLLSKETHVHLYSKV